VTEDAAADGTFHPSTQEGVFADTSYEGLQARLTALGFEDRITLVRGYFQDTLRNFESRTFRVVHLDCDMFQSYMTCLEFFYPRLERGGFMLFDEYDLCGDVYPGAKKAIDSFFADKSETLRCFPEAEKPRWFIEKL
ncbi:MAG: class I SAM-dependent methyltransferase, partial [Candidatus Eremiobacteraeota bacterium]|nr:class I SAM-dependent methyltransferase [Candidatus Eremiobacteraeota bacterium]